MSSAIDWPSSAASSRKGDGLFFREQYLCPDYLALHQI